LSYQTFSDQKYSDDEKYISSFLIFGRGKMIPNYFIDCLLLILKTANLLKKNSIITFLTFDNILIEMSSLRGNPNDSKE
jgi:hypothetical protein